MIKYTDTQKRIAVLLLHESKTIDELHNQLNIPYDELMRELKPMLKLDLIYREQGFPPKYKLKREISDTVKRRKKMAEEDKNKIRLNAIIEVQAIEENLLKKQLKEIREALEKEEFFQVYDVMEAEIAEQDEHYSSYLEVSLSAKNLMALMRLMFLYGPTSVEVLKPEKFEVEMGELQEALMAMADVVHSYTEYIAKKLSREELENFNKQLFG
ncbi:MAG: hypothetical protein ABIE23_06450 [archaeon]|nr:hypothetical protein [Candidatus Micrarchaeota archaeon]